MVSADIKVYAAFPADPSEWVHCLTFPLETLSRLQLTPTPYKWIRYAIGVVLGAQGHLSFSPLSSHEVVDYNLGLPSDSVELFYHTSNAEKQRMFPIDPDMNRTSIPGSTENSLMRGLSDSELHRDHDDVVERDGVCVLTGASKRGCDVVHIMPHSKGNEYIKTYTEHRSRDPAGNDIIDEIDDIRNGTLLNAIAHKHLGTEIAFLMTPNFAMSTADIDPSASPMETRYTGHLFYPDTWCFGDNALHSGCQMRMPETPDNWPPSILFDAVYASTVLHHFASPTLKDALEQWKFDFYSRGPMTPAQANYQKILDERAALEKRKNEQDLARDQRAAKRSERVNHEDDSYAHSDVFLMPWLFMLADKHEAFCRKLGEMRMEKERIRLEHKVAGWAKEVANALP